MRREEEPVESPSSHDSTEYNHPAYGMIGANRVSGGTTLFGSDFVHQHFVTITVRHAKFRRDLSRDWHHGTNEIVEVALSEAQWATFVSSMNVGDGVPCTLERIGREFIPSIPLRKQEDAHRAEFADDLKNATALVDAAIGDIEGEIGAAVSATKRGKILARLLLLRRKLSDSMPFVAQSFAKHMEVTVEKAKVEVNAYIQQSVMRAGLDALGARATAPLLLESPAAPPTPKDAE